MTIREVLATRIAAAFSGLPGDVLHTNGRDLSDVLKSEVIADDDVMVLGYDGYEINPDSNEDGTYPDGESDTIHLFKLQMRIRSDGLTHDECTERFALLRRYFRLRANTRFTLMIDDSLIHYLITLDNGAVVPVPDAGFSEFIIPITVS